MGLKQFKRGMRHRFKYMRLRLRLQVRHMAMHRKARKAAGPSCDMPAPAFAPQHLDAEQADAPPPTTALPTLRRRPDHKTAL